MEMWIKRFMAARLQTLLDGRWDEGIKARGGLLTGVVMEVMAEELRGKVRSSPGKPRVEVTGGVWLVRQVE